MNSVGFSEESHSGFDDAFTAECPDALKFSSPMARALGRVTTDDEEIIGSVEIGGWL